MDQFKLRIILGISLAISVFVVPFWASAALALLGLIFIPYYWECLIFLLCVDVLYRGGVSDEIRIWYPFTAVLLFALIQVIRGYLRQREGS